MDIYGRSFFIINGYLSPSITDKDVITEFFVTIIKAFNSHPKSEWLLLGDLNAKSNLIHPTMSPNFAGEILAKMLELEHIDNCVLSKPIQLLNDQPTRVTDRCSNLLDVIICSNQKLFSFVQMQSESDHDLFLIDIIPPSTAAVKKSVIDYSSPDINIFKKEMEITTTKVKNLHSKSLAKKKYTAIVAIEEMAKILCQGIVKATKESCPVKTFTQNNSNGPISNSCKKKMNSLLAKKRKNQATKKDIKDLEKIKQSIDSRFAKNEAKIWNDINKLNFSDSKSFHDGIKKILGKDSSNLVISLEGDDKYKSTADHFASYFENILNENAKAKFDKKCKQVCKTKCEKWFISTNDIHSAILKTNDKLSAGLDGTTYVMFKINPSSLLDPLKLLIDRMLDLCYYPDYFKCAKAIVIHKKNSRSDPGNYRVIALLNMLSKVIEIIISKKILAHLMKHNILYAAQNGYRCGHSTDDLVIELLLFITECKGTRVKFGIIFYDYRKAFDFLNIDRLLIKLKSMGFTLAQRNFIESYLRDRKFLFFVNNQFASKTCNLKSGVPQGSILGPLLWLMQSHFIPCFLLI